MEIILKRTFDSRIDRTLNRVLQIFGEGCDMRIVGARIGGKLLPAQFTTLPGTVERMLQDRSFANRTIQNMQGFFDCHKTYNGSAQLVETQAQKWYPAKACQAIQFHWECMTMKRAANA